tara:strand:+ start:1515 stop:1958 length:444 start_codon:yes stop_codon:yes gene_type:complete
MWILIFATLITTGNLGITNVGGFTTKQDCLEYASYLFKDWDVSQENEANWYHRTTSDMKFVEREEGEIVTYYSCVPIIRANCNGNPDWKKCLTSSPQRPSAELHFEARYPELCITSGKCGEDSVSTIKNSMKCFIEPGPYCNEEMKK